MLPTELYNKNKYGSLEEAGEDVYNIKYFTDKVVITTPNRLSKEIKLNYPPQCGLDVSDFKKIDDFIFKDMYDNKYNIAQIREAGAAGEICSIDIEHLIDILKLLNTKK